MRNNELSITNTGSVKQFNTKAVLHSLKRKRIATVKELSLDCGLSIVTVNGIINTLVRQERVFLKDMIPSGGGRPSQRYRFNESFNLALLLFSEEIQGEKSVYLKIINLFGDIVETDNLGAVQISFKKLESVIGKKIKKYPQIGSICIGIPGVEFQGEIVSGDYNVLLSEPIVEMLNSRFGIPVLIENDVNAAVLGSAEKDEDFQGTLVYIYFPRNYPPGAGILVEGNLHKGSKNFAGEVGWLPLEFPWTMKTADTFLDSCKYVAGIVVAFTAILAPDVIRLYGEHLGPAHLDMIKKLSKSQLPEHITPNLSLATNFHTDFEKGLIHLALGRLLK